MTHVVHLTKPYPPDHTRPNLIHLTKPYPPDQTLLT